MMCIAAMKTMTAAQKGKKSLRMAGIESEIVSLDATLTKNGCAYGLQFPCQRSTQAERVLKANRVNFGEIIG